MILTRQNNYYQTTIVIEIKKMLMVYSGGHSCRRVIPQIQFDRSEK